MYKLLILASVCCAANAGVLAGAYAAGPALGAPLVGSVSYTAPEITVVKQPITVDQPEIRYRSVPTVVHQTSVVRAAPVLAAPLPIASHAFAYAAHQPALAYNYNNLGYGYGALPAFGYAQAF